jgi:hypothetical protein
VQFLVLLGDSRGRLLGVDPGLEGVANVLQTTQGRLSNLRLALSPQQSPAFKTVPGTKPRTARSVGNGGILGKWPISTGRRGVRRTAAIWGRNGEISRK